MALFRFEIKSDKNKSGNKTSAKLHVEYIDRMGRFRDIDQHELEKRSTENYITGEKLIEHQPGKEILLYTSPYGTIRQDDAGIKVSQGASEQTIAIAMLVAQNLYDSEELSLHGSEKFRQSAIRAALLQELPVSFTKDTNSIKSVREEILNDRRRFEQKGGKYISPGGINGAFDTNGKFGNNSRNNTNSFPESNITINGSNKSDLTGSSISEKAKRGFSMPTLSSGYMDVSGRTSDVLLSDDEYRNLQQHIRTRQQAYPQLRWNVHGTRSTAAKLTTDKIMYNLQNHLGKTFASSHVQYINRETRFKQRGGCLKTGHHLPAWAEGSARKFFDAAEKYEAKNAEHYKEIVIALPNELALSQQEEIVNSFLEQHLKDYYYAWAIHDKIGSMSNGEKQPHVHIMFSTRQIDEYERNVGRDAKLFFKKASSTELKPELGGCKKADCWIGKDRFRFLSLLRESTAKIQNEVLEKYGHAVRVDHRSIKARRKDALANGNLFLAEILDKIPESSVGPTALLNENSEKLQTQKKLRQYNFSKFKSKISKNILSCNIEMEKISHIYASNEKSITEIRTLLNTDEEHHLHSEIANIKALTKEINALQIALINSHDAIEEAMIDHMPKDSREIWSNFKNFAQERKNWLAFKESLRTDEISNDELRKDLLEAVEHEVSRLTNKLHEQAPNVRMIFDQLNLQSKKQQIHIDAGNKIFENSFTRKNIKKLLLKQQQAIADLSQKYQKKLSAEISDNGYTAAKISTSLETELKSLYEKAADLRKELSVIKHKTISPERALVMAKNNYVNTILKRDPSLLQMNFKQIREAQRKMKKAIIPGKYTPSEQSLWQLEKHEKFLEDLCSSPAGKIKINEIAAGILQKNSSIAMRFAKLSSQHKTVQDRIDSIKPLAKAAKSQSYKDNQNKCYKLTGASSSLRSSAPIIAAALAGNEKFTPLVLQNKKDRDEDDWELLTEAEKDEIRDKVRS